MDFIRRRHFNCYAQVDETPIKDSGAPGRVVVGQIYGQDDELVRLYYESGKVYFMNDQAGPDNEETKFTFKNADGKQPNIALGETFSYMIDARGSKLTVKILADGDEYVSNTKINSVWKSDTFYFKAGVYLGVNENSGYGEGQASFYALDFSHKAGDGMGGWDVNDSAVFDFDEQAAPIVEEHTAEPADHHDLFLSGDFAAFSFWD